MAPHDQWLPEGYSTKWSQAWLENAERQGVAPQVVVEIARRHSITPHRFGVLDKMAEIKDPDGKSFFLVPPRTRGDDVRTAVLMTYIVNAGTGYGKAGKHRGDFLATPYSAAEITRIINRQNANSWTYTRDVGFVGRNGGRLVTTPNGMLMGLGGNWIQQQFTRRGGTTWGDIFMVNLGKLADPAAQLRQIVQSGHAWYVDGRGNRFESSLVLDRILHHEERHSQQWAAKGYAGTLRGYSWELIRQWVFGKSNRLEEDAGLADGGYR